MTKVNSTNYTAAGTQFPISDNGLDDLEDDDIQLLQKAIEEHTHDATRGLAVRRVNTSAAPGAAGQVRINGDDFTWWAGTSGVIRTAATLNADQTWTGQQRFNSPIILPDQSDPSAPGAGLSVLYSKGGQIYKRSGASGTPTPVGSPNGYAITGKMFDTDGTPGTWCEQKRVQLSGSSLYNWVVAFDPGSSEMADFSFPVPPGYAGTPINFYLQWYANATGGATVWDISGLVTAPGAALTGSAVALVSTTTASNDSTANDYNVTTIPWTASTPTASSWVQARISRLPANGADNIGSDANVLALVVVFG